MKQIANYTVGLLAFTLINSFFTYAPSIEAGNVKKSYINLSKDGNQAQAADIPANYSQIENEFKKYSYDLGTGVVGKHIGFVTKNEEGLYLNGSGYVDMPQNAKFDITQTLTIEGWVKPEAYNAVGGILTYGSDGSEYEAYTLCTWSNPNRFMFGSNWPSAWYQLFTQTSYQTNTWYHVAATFNKGTAKIYVNGKLDGTATWPLTTLPLSPSRIMRIGMNQPGGDEVYKGTIRELRVWNKALDEAQIKSAMDKGTVGNEEGLVSYWKYQ